MEPYKSVVAVDFVVTHPAYQRRGLGKQMMEHGINMVKDAYEFVGLGVTVGNPAQGMYLAMGFVPDPLVHDLIWPSQDHTIHFIRV